jgi:putative heme-binding domain-containing protein
MPVFSRLSMTRTLCSANSRQTQGSRWRSTQIDVTLHSHKDDPMIHVTSTFPRFVLAAAALVTLAPGVMALTSEPRQTTAQDDQAKEAVLTEQMRDEKAGTPAAGRKTFEERCAVCHRFGGVGKDVGPDLTTVASRFKRRDVLESILWPSKVISDQYLPEIFELADGKVVSGLIVRENATAVLVRTPENPDKPAVVQKSQITNRSQSTVSLMPEGLHDKLTASELADLLAFVLAPPPDK